MNTVQKMSCAIAAALLCGHAAASSVEAKISDIQLALIDLKPDDGVLPSFDLSGGGPNYSSAYLSSEGPHGNWSDFKQSFLATVSTGSLVGQDHGFTGVAPTELQVHLGNAGPSGTRIWFGGATTYRGNTSGSPINGLTLAPFSALHVTALASLTLVRTDGDWVNTSFTASYATAADQKWVFEVLDSDQYGAGDLSITRQTPIDFLISNATANPLQVAVGFSVNGITQTAVPEPGTIGLLLGGLAIVAAARRPRVDTAGTGLD